MGRFLRSKRLRNAVWRQAGGKCQRCGCDLPEDWHVDHVTPWSAGGASAFHNYMALCPRCNLKKGASMSWQTFLRISDKFQARKAITDAFQWAATTTEFDSDDLRKVIDLITGYGKTLCIYGIFAILKARGLVERLLVLVPGDEQRKQFCDDEIDAAEMLGVRLAAQAVEKRSAEFSYNSRGERLVFVATYAQLSDGHLKDLMSDGDLTWMLVYDECHHLADDNLWGERAEQLPAVFRLYSTGTMKRSDRKSLRGFPAERSAVIARADYKMAHREEAVKQVFCCNEHYRVVCDTIDGKPFEVTTEDLKREKVKDYPTYEAKRQLRYNSDYLWGLLLDPIMMLSGKRSQHPAMPHKGGQAPQHVHQMLVFAMSCKHAAHIAEVIRSVCQSVGFNFSCDWVGVGDGPDGIKKSDRENSDIVGKYRRGELDILVSVQKVGEGFSVKTASVLVFLNLLTADNTLLQQIGRGLRRFLGIPFNEDSCHVFCGSDSAVAQLVRTMEQQVKDPKEEKEGPGGDGPWLFDILELVVIKADHVRREVICPVEPTPENIASVLSEYDLRFCQEENIDPVKFYKHVIARSGLAPKGFEPTARSSREQEEAIRSQVNHGTSTLVGNIIRLMKDQGHPVNGETAGRIKKRVNTQWVAHSGGKTHDKMTMGEMQRKHGWIKQVNQQLKHTKELPDWVLR